MDICEMCGWEAETVFGKQYQYDNGKQFTAKVCGSCLWVGGKK